MTTETQAGADTTQPGVQAEAGGKPADTTAVDAANKEATSPEVKTDPATDPAKTEAEVTYEFKTPEGMELDQASLGDFTAIAKELKLPADAAQKLVDIAVKREVARAEAHTAAVNGWADQVKADKDIGGDKLQESLAVAKKAIDLGPPELKELLNASGLGNHPAVVKWAFTVGKALSEDTFKSGQPVPAEKSVAERLYGSPAKT